MKVKEKEWTIIATGDLIYCTQNERKKNELRSESKVLQKNFIFQYSGEIFFFVTPKTISW